MNNAVKISIEKYRYDNFCRDFKKGKYGNQRFGQAFYNEFRLDKSSVNTHNIWAKDGDEAKRSIETFVEFC